jgi:LysR family transcriptional regulator, glycine cleavage system transcriptional activator
MKTPQVTWLRSFEAAARRGSFSAAADDLGLTPAAVSQQIRLLEKHLGAQLFERLPKGVVLTDTGQAYAQPIRKSFSEMQAATEGLFGSRSRKTVKVRSSISYAALVLAPQLGAFRTTYPDIDVQLSTTVWSDRIETDDIDVDIRYGNGEWDDGTIWRLGDEQASVVCSPQFAASFGGSVDFKALYGAPVVQIIGSEVEWVRMLDHYDLELDPPVAWLKADSSLMALQIILSGLGSAIVMERFSRSFVAQGLLVEPLAYRLPILQSYFLVVTDKAERRDEVRSFCRWLAGW